MQFCALLVETLRLFTMKLNPKHTGLFATLFIPGVDKFVHQLYRDNECPDKKCKANIPSASNLEHILFLQRPWKNFLSNLKVPLNLNNFYYQRLMRELAFLRFLAQKMLQSKNKGILSLVFYNFRQLLFYENSL